MFYSVAHSGALGKRRNELFRLPFGPLIPVISQLGNPNAFLPLKGNAAYFLLIGWRITVFHVSGAAFLGSDR